MATSPGTDDGHYVFNDLLGRLVGGQLSSVVFVADYCQLVFWTPGPESGYPTLNCDVWPRVSVAGTTLTINDAGYRDALCSLIMDTVTATGEAPGQGLTLTFTRGAIKLCPAIEEIEGPEIALLGGFDDKHWMCWRPGEEAFEYLA
jgi:hypothetical protein